MHYECIILPISEIIGYFKYDIVLLVERIETMHNLHNDNKLTNRFVFMFRDLTINIEVIHLKTVKAQTPKI